MANRLPLLTVLLLLAALLLAAAAHGAPAVQAPIPHTLAFDEPFEGEFESDEAEGEEDECETAREEVAEEELGQDEADEICAEEADEDDSSAPPAKHHRRGHGKHRAHPHKKACRPRAAGKRQCSRRSSRH